MCDDYKKVVIASYSTINYSHFLLFTKFPSEQYNIISFATSVQRNITMMHIICVCYLYGHCVVSIQNYVVIAYYPTIIYSHFLHFVNLAI